MTPFDFHFIRPLWLLLVFPMAWLLWRLHRSEGRSDIWRQVVDAHLLRRMLSDDGGRVQRLPLIMLGLGWLLLVLALAGPTWERLPQPLYQAQQYRVLALDLSPSMHAGDLKPSRLAHARFEILDLLGRAGEGQTALIVYGAEPFVVSPLTTDAATIAAQVPLLDTGLLPVMGARRTDLALEKAGELLRQAGAPEGEVILVTDDIGQPAAAAAAAGALRAEGYRVSVLGVGTEKGAPIALPGGGFAKDPDGAIVLPRLDADALATLASAGGGRYVGVRLDDRDIAALLPAGGGRGADAAEQPDARSEQWREEGPWLLLLLLPVAALAFRRGWLSPMLLLVIVLPAPDAYAIGWDDLWARPDQRAARQLEAGRPAEAAALFERPDWRAAAQYQAGDYVQALESLEAREDAGSAYNRGNSLARLGRLEDAVAAYDQALEVDPQDADARHNRDLVQGLLERRRQGQSDRRPNQEEGLPARDQPRQDDQSTDDQRQSQPESSQSESDQSESDQSESDQSESDQSESADSGTPGEQAEQGQQDDQAQQGGESSQGEQNASAEAADETGRGAPQPGEQDQGGASSGSDTQSAGAEGETQDDAGQSADAQREQTEGAAGDRVGGEQRQATGDGETVDEPDAGGETRQSAGADGREAEAEQQAAQDAAESGRPGEAAETPDAQRADAADTGETGEQSAGDRLSAGQEADAGPDREAGEMPREEAEADGRDGQEGDGSTGVAADERDQPGPGGDQAAGGDEETGRAGGELTADRRDGQGDDAGPPETAGAAAGPEGPSAGPAERPGLEDLMGGRGQGSDPQRRPMQTADGYGEDRQALEQMLRRVEDDPGGLLRQRFLLQYLRRNGQLP